MPRASWRGFLRLSLVSCPIYLSPATVQPVFSPSITLNEALQTRMQCAGSTLAERRAGNAGLL